MGNGTYGGPRLTRTVSVGKGISCPGHEEKEAPTPSGVVPINSLKVPRHVKIKGRRFQKRGCASPPAFFISPREAKQEGGLYVRGTPAAEGLERATPRKGFALRDKDGAIRGGDTKGTGSKGDAVTVALGVPL